MTHYYPGTNLTIIGNRAFAFRRFNRTNDFRSSGSGKIDCDLAYIDLETVRLAFQVAQKLGTSLWRSMRCVAGEERLIVEMSYTHVPRAHVGGGRVRPEDAIFVDFLALIRSDAPQSLTR